MSNATITNPNVDPFAFLGTDVSEADDLDQMLSDAGADFNAVLSPLQTTLEDGTEIDVPSHKALIRDDTSGVLHVVTNTYHPIQYREVMDYALAAVDLRPGDAAIENIGLMAKGAEFFATINLGSLFIDPAGINDEICRRLAVFSSHNGKLAIMLAATNMRVICSNMAPAIRGNSTNKVTVKHTKNAKDRLDAARQALGIADFAAKQFEEDANKLLGIPANKDTVVRVANKIWPLKDDASDKGKTQHANRLSRLVSIFEGERCEQNFGSNAWSAFNAFTEYLDHGRGTSEEKRALASVVPGGHVEKAKVLAGTFLLN